MKVPQLRKKSEIKSPSNCSKTCTVVQKNEQFKCKYCKKKFKKKYNLKRHVKTCKEKEQNENLKEELFELLLVNKFQLVLSIEIFSIFSNKFNIKILLDKSGL